MVIVFFAKGLEFIALAIFVLYMLIESRFRHRTWADNGFSLRTIPVGLRQNLGWILLVTLGAQAFFIFSEYFFLPEVFAHIIARLPLDIKALNVDLFITLAIGAFLEELLFRALFQNRLSAFLRPDLAIGLASLVFALVHYSPGPTLIVVADLLGVFVDGVIYGIIFQRSKNVFVAWIPHFLADVVALVILLLIR